MATAPTSTDRLAFLGPPKIIPKSASSRRSQQKKQRGRSRSGTSEATFSFEHRREEDDEIEQPNPASSSFFLPINVLLSCPIDLSKMQKFLSQHMNNAAIALLTITGVFVMVSHLASPGSLSSTSALQLRRSMQEVVMTPVVADPAPQQQPDSNNNNMACNIRPPEPREIGSTVIASYPGSGAKLSWKTIRALTGIMTSDDYDHNGLASKNAAVAIKTHYPALGDENGLPTVIAYVPRAILLLRNPLNAIPSLHNFEYEQVHNLPNHSTRAPTEEWIAWRNERFDTELIKWRTHLTYWMDRYPAVSRTVLTFERMVNIDTGVEEFAKLGRGLQKRDPRIELPPDEDLPCIWEVLVSDKRVGDEGSRRKSRRAGSERGPPPYEFEHLDRMEGMFNELKDTYLEREGVEGDLPAIMDEYVAMVHHVRNSMKEGNGPSVEERIEQEAQERQAREEAERLRKEEQEGMPGWEEMQLAEAMREKRLVAAKRARNEKHDRIAERQSGQARQEEGSLVAATS